MNQPAISEPVARLPLHADVAALRADEDGIVRVGRSRITLDLIVELYENGMSPEDMVRAHDALELADVHAAIAYYLRHRNEVRSNLERRKEAAEALKAKIEVEHLPVTRDELIGRRIAREQANAAAGQ